MSKKYESVRLGYEVDDGCHGNKTGKIHVENSMTSTDQKSSHLSFGLLHLLFD